MRENNRSILIVGCGSLGRSLVRHLKDAARVVCCDIDPDVVRSMQKDVRITDDLDEYTGQSFDLIIVATKSNDVRSVVKSAVSCHSKAVLFLQNGDFPLNWVPRMLPGVEVYRGVTTSACQVSPDGVLNIFLKGTFFLGAYTEERRYLTSIVRTFRKVGLKTEVVKDYRSAVWAKLIFSAVMNPLPILTGCGYGVISKDRGVDLLVMDGIAEGKKVAVRENIRLAFDPGRMVRRLKAGIFGDFSYRGSMYYDFVNSRPLELDFITGALIRRARQLGVKTPVLDSFYAMTKTMERIRDSQG